MHELLRSGWVHDDGCQCVPCLKTVYVTANEKAVGCLRAYVALREEAARPQEMNRARAEWTQARQEVILADHALRTAEDRDRLAEISAKGDMTLQWHPGGGR